MNSSIYVALPKNKFAYSYGITYYQSFTIEIFSMYFHIFFAFETFQSTYL